MSIRMRQHDDLDFQGKRISRAKEIASLHPFERGEQVVLQSLGRLKGIYCRI